MEGGSLGRILSVTASLTVIGAGVFSLLSAAKAPPSERTPSKITAIHVLLVVALLEVVINRVAVPMLRPPVGLPPAWHTALDYLGLFLFYFAGTLAAFVILA